MYTMMQCLAYCTRQVCYVYGRPRCLPTLQLPDSVSPSANPRRTCRGEKRALVDRSIRKLKSALVDGLAFSAGSACKPCLNKSLLQLVILKEISHTRRQTPSTTDTYILRQVSLLCLFVVARAHGASGPAPIVEARTDTKTWDPYYFTRGRYIPTHRGLSAGGASQSAHD